MTKQLEEEINDESQLDYLQKRYIKSYQDFFYKVINKENLGFEAIETSEMIQYLVLLDDLQFFRNEDTNELEMHVICNDLFVWGCSDLMQVTWDEVSDLFMMCLEDSKFGSQKWCCKKENRKPQTPFINWMRKENAWEAWMDKLQDSLM